MKNKEIIKAEYENLKNQLVQVTVLQNIKEANQGKCEHNIVALLGYKEFRSGTNMYNSIPVYKCLFCGYERTSNVELKKSIIINATNYNSNSFDMNKEEDITNKFNIIRNVVFKMATEIPEMTNEELQIMANQSLNGYSYTKK